MSLSNRILLAAFACTIFWPVVAAAERLTLERAYDDRPLVGETASGVQISPDGRYVSFLRAARDDAKASVLWIVRSKGGAPRPLLDSRKLGESNQALSEERMKFLERRYQTSGDSISYGWSADGEHVLVTYNEDLYLVAVANGSVRRLTRDDQSELDAKIAPGSRNISFLRGRDLIIHSLADKSERRVAKDASDTVSYGTSEFVAQEEMRRFTGQWWAPDGSRIAFTRVDESGVKSIPRIRIDADGTSIVTDRYPLTGTPNAAVRLFVQDAAGTSTIEADLGRDPDYYLVNVHWSPDGSRLYVLKQSRDQKRLDLIEVNPASGAARLILSEPSATYTDIERDFRPLRDGNFIWGSPRSGYRHLYLYDRQGKLIRRVTSGNWRITNIGAAGPIDLSTVVGADEGKGVVYFLGSETPTEAHLYRVSYKREDRPRRITGGKGWWWPYMANAATPTVFVGSYSDPERPPNTAIYDLNGRRIAWIAENPLNASHPIFPYLDHRPTAEFGTIKSVNGEDLHYVLSKPANFDPARRYPVLIRVYGGPGVQLVRRDWRGDPTDQLYAQEGFLLFTLDNRGSVNRSTTFEHALYHNMGGANTEDQLAGVRFLKSLPFVDPDRIGMYGWSYGAYMTFRMMTTPGSGIRAGAAGGIPSEFGLYDTHYTERFLGTPQGNPDAYRISDLLPRAKDLEGNLLLMHGLSDDNVVIANFTRLVAALQKEGKLFETAVYPGMAHVPRGSHLRATQIDFFKRRLAPRDEKSR